VRALSLTGIEVALGERTVLRGVDLELGTGELVGLVGRNGAGKTTLLRVATRVLAPRAGEVLLRGRPLAEHSRRELAREIAVVAQDTTLPFAFTVAELVLMGRAPHLGWLGFERAHDHALAEAALERLGLLHLAERSVLEISGGERQLVLIARALAQEAPVLLLDEPTAHLDLHHRLQVLGLLRELAREGRTVLVISHDLTLVARFCDRLALLSEGQLEVGSPAELLQPERLRAGFGLDAEILHTAAGEPVVVPHLSR